MIRGHHPFEHVDVSSRPGGLANAARRAITAANSVISLASIPNAALIFRMVAYEAERCPRSTPATVLSARPAASASAPIVMRRVARHARSVFGVAASPEASTHLGHVLIVFLFDLERLFRHRLQVDFQRA